MSLPMPALGEAWEPRSAMEGPESHYVREKKHKLLRRAIHQLPPVYLR
jgi:hypothetical protein